MSSLTTQEIADIIAICETLEQQFSFVIESNSSTPATYILEVLGRLQLRVWDDAKRVEGYAQGQRTAFAKADSAAVQIEQMHKDYAQLKDTREKICDAISDLCTTVVEQSVTHGQKNGMLLMIAALARKWKYSEYGANGIPF